MRDANEDVCRLSSGLIGGGGSKGWRRHGGRRAERRRGGGGRRIIQTDVVIAVTVAWVTAQFKNFADQRNWSVSTLDWLMQNISRQLQSLGS